MVLEGVGNSAIKRMFNEVHIVVGCSGMVSVAFLLENTDPKVKGNPITKKDRRRSAREAKGHFLGGNKSRGKLVEERL